MTQAEPIKANHATTANKSSLPASTKSFFFSPVVQTKLTVNQPGDKFEQEADAIADRVVNPSNTVQKKCADCASDDKKNLQRQPSNVQRSGQTNTVDAATESSINQSIGKGESLPEETKLSMQDELGTDLDNVKIHTDSHAAGLSETLNARAFATGNDVYFNKDQYKPNTSEGKHLLAHELTHVAQQSGNVQPSLIQRDPPATPSPSPSLSLQGLTLNFTYGSFTSSLSLPNSISASLPIRLRNIGLLTINVSSTIPSEFALSVTLDTIQNIRISGRVAYNADSSVGTAGLSISSMQRVCTIADPVATNARLTTLSAALQTAIQGFDPSNPETTIALGSAIYDLYDAAKNATERCILQPLWSLDLGGHMPLQPRPDVMGGGPGAQPPPAYLGATFTFHF